MSALYRPSGPKRFDFEDILRHEECDLPAKMRQEVDENGFFLWR